VGRNFSATPQVCNFGRAPQIAAFFVSFRNFAAARNFLLFCRILCWSNRRISNLTRVFQALIHLVHTEQNIVLSFLCQNIAVLTIFLYRTLFPTQKSLNAFYCKLRYARSFHAYSAQIFRNFAAFLLQFLSQNCGNFPFFAAIFCKDYLSKYCCTIPQNV